LTAMARLIVAGVAPKDAADKALKLTIKNGKSSVEKICQKSEDQSDLVQLIHKSATKFDQTKIERLIRKSIAEIGVEGTWVEVISPLLTEIGDDWARTGVGIEIEHLVSEILQKILSENFGNLAKPKNARPVLLACIGEELHSLALTALAAVLAEAKIKCIFLGARTPQEAINQIVIKTAPPVIFLWAQLSQNADFNFVKKLPSIRPAPRVFLGGPGWTASKGRGSNKLISDKTILTTGLGDARDQIRQALAL
ncbi:MAG: cobalamin B12-binding domain-containing protein, partial [SAR202 cluster bacterium]|nr:cobalamin B12-binding domain-containing protein [SAR202 cluster bacterium]